MKGLHVKFVGYMDMTYFDNSCSHAKVRLKRTVKVAQPRVFLFQFLNPCKNEDIFSFKVYQNIFSFVFNDPI